MMNVRAMTKYLSEQTTRHKTYLMVHAQVACLNRN